MQLIISDRCTIKKVPPCCSFLPLLYIFLLNILTPTPTRPVTNRLSVTYASHPFLSFDLHPHTQCLSNPPYFFSPPFCSLSSCLSIHPSNRQQWQRPGALHGAAPARGAGPAAGSDQVHQEGATVSLQRLQERMSVCWLLTVPDSRCRKDLLSNIIFLSSLEQECPSGMVDEETFKTIYSQFFPQGGQRFSQVWIFYFSLSFSDLTFIIVPKAK